MNAKEIIKQALGIEWEDAEMQARRIAEFVTGQQPAAVGDMGPVRTLTDTEIVTVLHSLGIDTFASKYDFPEIQVSGTNLPGIRKIINRCNAITAPVPAAGVQGDWRDRLYAAMEVEFARYHGPERDADGQRLGMRTADTQVGVEFAMRWIEQNMLASTVHPDSGRDAEQAFEDGKRLAHEQATVVTHALMAERDEWKAKATAMDSGRDAALEEAARVCESGLIDDPTIYETSAMMKCARAIRALAAHPAPSSDAALKVAVLRDSLQAARYAFSQILGYVDTGTPRAICTKQMQDIDSDLAKALQIAAHPAPSSDAALSYAEWFNSLSEEESENLDSAQEHFGQIAWEAALAAHPAPSSDAAQEAAISAAMAEGNRHGVKSTVAARIVAAYTDAHPANGAQAWLSDEHQHAIATCINGGVEMGWVSDDMARAVLAATKKGN